MTERFVQIDLSRLPAPAVIESLDFEDILSEMKASAIEAAPELEEVLELESEPAVVVLQACAYQVLLARARVNDAARAVLVAFADGTDLDHLAAWYGTKRWEGEVDSELRRRVTLAPEAMATAGPLGAYLFHALSADARVLNADVWSPSPGEVTVAVQAREGDGHAAPDLIDTVRAHLARDEIKPLTDIVNVRSVENFPYEIAAEVFILPGPDPVAVRDEVTKSLEAMVAARRTPSRDVPRSAVFAAASVGPVDRVHVTSPAADIARNNGEVGLCTSIHVTVTVHDG